MKLVFESDLKYQSQAVEAVTDLFDGFSQDAADVSLTSEIVPNLSPSSFLDWDEVFDNYQEVFEETGIISDHRPTQIEMESGMQLPLPNAKNHEYPSFTIEMETGTGKTYVYFKTIYQLYRDYNFSKFVIVVPSRAIYEGVVKMFESTKAHFSSLYDKPNPVFYEYEGKPELVKAFAEITGLSILLMTLDSFNKLSNKLYKPTETVSGSGLLPYQFIAETKPILILDEPQNMTSDISKQAIRTLEPLFALHYSATHREILNQVYRLTPFEAYRDGLVKKIQVFGFHEYEQLKFSELELVSISKDGKTAKFKGYKDNNGFLQFSDSISLKTNQEVSSKTTNPHHRGLTINSIDRGEGTVEFSNGDVLHLSQNVKQSKEDLFRAQLRETILAHFARQSQLYSKGIKVLSLIFIDRVANYQEDDGIIRKLFEEEFNSLKKNHEYFSKYDASTVHNGYFAKKKNKKTGEDVYFDVFTKQEQKDAEKDAYKLIMKDKERLLSFDEDVCFVFAHSALKEGWDNPNVFQICTLSNTVSEIKKRQEIGRGLRLPVNQEGVRVKDLEENILTVIANESYETYVSSLQQEYEEAGELDKIKIGNARKEPVKRNQNVFNHKEFQSFWDKLLQRIHYTIDVNTPQLIKRAIEYINNNVNFPEPRLIKQHGYFGINQIILELDDVYRYQSKLKAKLHIIVQDTTGVSVNEVTYKCKVSEGIPLSSHIPNSIFRAFVIKEINSDQKYIVLGDGKKVYQNKPVEYQLAAHEKKTEIPVALQELNLPVPNFLEKMSMELGLTRRTIFEIFKGIETKKKQAITKNPEGFINEFQKALKTVYADHIAEYVSFQTHEEFTVHEPEIAYTTKDEIKSKEDFLTELFPAVKEFAGTELIEGDNKFIYDHVQIDSDIEETFIKEQVTQDPKVILYFKFPSKFKLRLPAVIGNYNPDWGIVIQDKTGKRTLHLVRETKGREDVRKLRFDHEKRKIVCAKKYFKTMGVDYRPISATTSNWWESV
jgi:type III restriction enzyme